MARCIKDELNFIDYPEIIISAAQKYNLTIHSMTNQWPFDILFNKTNIKVVTDHLALMWLNSIESPSGRISRWLQQYGFETACRKGQLAWWQTPYIKETTAPMASGGCSLIEDMCEKVRTQPQKYPDYVMKKETLYRNILNRADSKASHHRRCATQSSFGKQY